MGGKNKKPYYLNPPNSTDIQALRDFKPQANPAIGFAFGRAKNALRNSFMNPLGADTPAAVKDAMVYQGEQDLAQQEAQALREEENDLNRQEYLKRQGVAELTRPQLYTPPQNQGGGIGGALLGAAQTAPTF